MQPYVYMSSYIHLYIHIYVYTCVWEREKRNWVWKPIAQRNLKFFSWTCKWKLELCLEWRWNILTGLGFPPVQLLGWEFAARRCLLWVPVPQRYFSSGLVCPSGGPSQSDPGIAKHLTHLFRNLSLFYPKARLAISNSRTLSPTVS